MHVRHPTMVTWQAMPAAAAAADSGPAAPGPQPQLVLAPVEGFVAGGFDAAAVQQEVRQERQQLALQLERLQEQQQQGQLPGPDALDAGALAGRCRPNQVAAPPAPPAAASGPPPGWQHPAAPLWQAQQAPPWPPQQAHAAWPPQQAHAAWPQQQQPPPPPAAPAQRPGIMRPLYQHQPPVPLPMADGHFQQPVFYQLASMWQAPAAAAPPQPPPPPAAQQPQQEQQQQVEQGNKRAADDLRARLQGAKRPRAQDGAPSTGSTAGLAAEQQQAQQAAPPAAASEQQDNGSRPWLAGAPPSIRQLAGSGGSGACGGPGPELLFLGTGSAEPSKYRAASAIQLRCVALVGRQALLPCMPPCQGVGRVQGHSRPLL